jgi:hypothetical protein
VGCDDDDGGRETGDRDDAGAASGAEDFGAAHAAPQGQESERRFRREGVPCRALVSRKGDLFILSSVQEATGNIAQLLKLRLEAAGEWGLDDKGFLPKEGQVWALAQYYSKWIQEPETTSIAERVWIRQPRHDALNRTMASYFKTALFQRFRRPLSLG